MFTTHLYEFTIRQDEAIKEAQHYRLIKSLQDGKRASNRINRAIRTIFTSLLTH